VSGPDTGIPAAAGRRLGGAGRPFTSSLSVPEALLVREAGLEPISLVMGIAYYNVGLLGLQRGAAVGRAGSTLEARTLELRNLTNAWNEARRLSVARLREEAVAAGADAVVGVTIRRTEREWTSALIEFVATGTAVRATREPLATAAGPALSNLSGQDVAKLVRHGVRPVGIVGGSAVVYVGASGDQRRRSTGMMSSRVNQELPDFTDGVYQVRASVMDRVTREAEALSADGVVGVTFDRRGGRRDHEANGAATVDVIIEMHVIGTAIVDVPGEHPSPVPSMVLPLDR
jgi:uncharacterized protein YbjQ (UPF0145 family)